MMAFVDITDQLERAARNGTKAHLAPDLVRAIIAHPGYAAFQAERTKELVAKWDEANPPPTTAAEPSLALSGSGIAPSAKSGQSAGTTKELDQDAVGRAASRRASAAVAQTVHHRRRKTRSPITTPRGASQ